MVHCMLPSLLRGLPSSNPCCLIRFTLSLPCLLWSLCSAHCLDICSHAIMLPLFQPPRGIWFRNFFTHTASYIATLSSNHPLALVIPANEDIPLGQQPQPLILHLRPHHKINMNDLAKFKWIGSLFPWAKPIIENDKITQVVCKVLKGKKKSNISIAKSNNLWKHMGIN